MFHSSFFFPFSLDFEISGRRSCVRREVSGSVQLPGFTVAILAQGTNRGDALCAALLLNRVGTILARRKCLIHRFSFFFFV